MEAIFVLLGIGMVLGFLFGRWWTENHRARYNMRQQWDLRKEYRRGPYNGWWL